MPEHEAYIKVRVLHTNTYTLVQPDTHTRVRATLGPGGGVLSRGRHNARIYIIPRQPQPNSPLRSPRPSPRVPLYPRAVHNDKIDHRQSSSTLPAAAAADRALFPPRHGRPTIYYIICVCVFVQYTLATVFSRVFFFHLLRLHPGPNGFYI